MLSMCQAVVLGGLQGVGGVGNCGQYDYVVVTLTFMLLNPYTGVGVDFEFLVFLTHIPVLVATMTFWFS